MKKILFFIFVFELCSLSYANFFNSPVSFFGRVRTETKIGHNKKNKNKPVSIWAQPIIMPDGSVQVYVPPPQVVSFLNNPTSQNAKMYLTWEKQRIAKIVKATNILQEISEKENNPVPSSVNIHPTTNTYSTQNNPKQNTIPFSSPTIVYFAKQGCKFCMAEELVMDLFNKKYHNDVKIFGLWVGSKNSMPKISFPFHLSNGLEKKFKIGIYPAMIFYLPNKPEPIKLEGFVTGNQLIQFYQKIGGKL